MKIAVVCASGHSGRLILEEALKRGHQVTAFVRNSSKIADLKPTHVVEKDIMDITYDDVKDCDVIIDAFGAWDKDLLHLHTDTIKHLSDILSNKKNRLLVVGGAGSLYTDKTHTQKVYESPDFPPSIYPISKAQGESFEELKKRKDVNWTYLCPACIFDPKGPRTGKYEIGGDEVLQNKSGKSYISYSDYAIAMIDEAENNKFNQKRFTVVTE